VTEKDFQVYNKPPGQKCGVVVNSCMSLLEAMIESITV
jgi:hypothetical protein